MKLTPEHKASLQAKLNDKNWRLENLYMITGRSGRIQPFRPYPVQLTFFKNRHSRNFVPKPRKLGLSTGIVIDYLDACLFPTRNNDGSVNTVEAGHVDLTQDNAHKKLAMARLAWNEGPRHPDPAIAAIWRKIHENNQLVRDTSGELRWSNGCAQIAGVSFTGTTPQRLHISEYGHKAIFAQFSLIPAHPQNTA